MDSAKDFVANKIVAGKLALTGRSEGVATKDGVNSSRSVIKGSL